MRTKTRLLMLLPFAALACGGPFGDPTEVARLYWESMADQDVDTAREYAAPGTAEDVQLPNEDFTVDRIELVVAEIDDDRGIVPTSIDVTADEMDLHLEFETVLVRVDGRWLIDAEETNSNLGASAIESIVGTSLSGLGDMLGEALGGAMRGMAEGLEEGMRGLGEALADQADVAAEADPVRVNVKR